MENKKEYKKAIKILKKYDKLKKHLKFKSITDTNISFPYYQKSVIKNYSKS